MLNGGGVNPDGLSLDLQFATDKTLTARRGPTPAFTRGSTGTFVGSNGLIQTAANNEPRFDHDPVTLASRGLLIEEGRTNLSLQSGVIVNNSGWATLDVTAAVSGTGLDGNNAYKISEVASTNIHALANLGGTGGASATSVVSGTNYTGSIFVKKVVGSVDWVQLTFGSVGFGVLQFANFNISNGTIGNSAGLTAGTVPRIEGFSNGWYRISMTAPATATTSSTSNVALVFTNNTNTTTRAPSYLGSTSNEVLTSLWQFEAGSFPTSYIPTTTGTLARSADVCSITGGDFNNFYNQSEGTLFADITPQSIAQLATVLAVNSGSSQNQHGIYKTNAALAAAGLRWGATSVLTGFVTQAAIVTGTDVAISRSKLSYAYKLDDFSFAYAGTIVGTDTSGTLPSPTTMQIGNRDGTLQINGHLASIRYYKKRLPNAKLQALTA